MAISFFFYNSYVNMRCCVGSEAVTYRLSCSRYPHSFKKIKKKFYTEDHRFPKRKMSTASLIL